MIVMWSSQEAASPEEGDGGSSADGTRSDRSVSCTAA